MGFKGAKLQGPVFQMNIYNLLMDEKERRVRSRRFESRLNLWRDFFLTRQFFRQKKYQYSVEMQWKIVSNQKAELQKCQPIGFHASSLFTGTKL